MKTDIQFSQILIPMERFPRFACIMHNEQNIDIRFKLELIRHSNPISNRQVFRNYDNTQAEIRNLFF